MRAAKKAEGTEEQKLRAELVKAREMTKMFLRVLIRQAEYNGTVARAFHRGHIPKSVNVEWSNNLHNEKFLEFDALVRLYSFISKETEVITYCQGGYRAANTYLALKQLGYPKVRVYLGSWGEWGNNPTLPVELN